MRIHRYVYAPVFRNGNAQNKYSVTVPGKILNPDPECMLKSQFSIKKKLNDFHKNIIKVYESMVHLGIHRHIVFEF